MSNGIGGLDEELKNSYASGRILGKVVDNNDPKKWNRVRVEVPKLYGDTPVEELPWCTPRDISHAGNTSTCGSFGVPVLGSFVYVTLKDNDPNFPEWEGGPTATRTKKGEIQDTNYPFRYGHLDERGNYIYVDRQTDDIEILHKSGTKIHIAPNGAVTVEIVNNETIHVAGNVNLDIDGDLTANVDGNVNATVGGDVSAEVEGNLDCIANGTGNLESGGAMTLKGSTVTIIGTTITHQGAVSGNSTATYTGDVVGAGKSLSTHKHGGVQAGSGQTSTPV